VSLRTDIHSAFDELAPSTFGLPERVVQTVVAERSDRGRRERLMFRMRAPLSLVAVLMLIAMVVGVLIGGRLVQDWNAFHAPAPAGGGQQSDLAQLEARPFQLPQLKAGDICADGPSDSSGRYGTGPVHGIPTGAHTETSWGTYWDLRLATDPNLTGLVLVRARDLGTNQPFVFTGQYAAGPVVGTDTLSGKSVAQHSYLVLDVAHPPAKPNSDHQLIWDFRAGVPSGFSGCFGWQFDGTGFTENFRFFL